MRAAAGDASALFEAAIDVEHGHHVTQDPGGRRDVCAVVNTRIIAVRVVYEHRGIEI